MVLLVSSWSGMRLVSMLDKSLTPARLWAIGILLGGLLMSFSLLIIARLELGRWWSVIPVIAIGVLMRVKILRGWATIRLNDLPIIDRTTIVRAGGLSLIGYNTFSMWTTVIGIAILLSPRAEIIRFSTRTTARAYSIALLVTCTTISSFLLNLQPRWHWAQSNDAPFFEAMSTIVAQYGPDAHPGYLNGSIGGYHYLAYLWSGALTTISDAQPFLVLNLVLPLLSVFSISLLLLEHRGKEPQSTSNTLLVLSLILAIRYSSFTSENLSTWALIVYVVLLMQFFTSEPMSDARSRKLQRESLLFVVGAAAVLGKGTSLPIVVSLCLAVLIVAFATSSGRPFARALSVFPTHVPILVLLAFTWYSPTDSQAIVNSTDTNLLSAIKTLGLNEGLWAHGDILKMSPAFVLLGLVALIAARSGSSQLVRRLYTCLCLFCVFAAAAQIMLPDATLRTYVAGHGFLVVLTTLFIILAINNGNKVLHNINRHFVVSLATSFVIIAFVDVYILPSYVESLWPTATPRSRWIVLLISNSRFLLMIIATLSLACLFPLWKTFGIRSSRSRQFIAVQAAIPLLIVGVATWHVTNRLDQVSWLLKPPPNLPEFAFSASHPDTDTLELGIWIRDNTINETVLASNSFCCKGTQWLDIALAQLREIDMNYKTLRNREIAYGGANYLLPAVTQRRFLLAGPRFYASPGTIVTNASDNSESEILIWLEASVRFGESGDRQLGQVLKAGGADYFIVDKFALAEPSLIPDFQLPRYENSRYLVVEL